MARQKSLSIPLYPNKMEAKSNSGDDVTSGSGDASPSPALMTPSDVINCVFSQLECVDLVNCSLVCKQWCLDSGELREGWKQTYQRFREEVVDKIKKFQNYFSQATDRSRPDFVAFDSMQDVSPKEDHIGSILGVQVGDSFHFRVELILLGLHKNLRDGVSYKKLGDGPEMRKIATSVVAKELDENHKMMPNYDVLISEGTWEYCKKTRVKDLNTPKHSGNRGLVESMREKIKVRVIYGRAMKTGYGKQAMIYTYCGLYYVTGYEVHLVGKNECFIRYTFKLERINRDRAVVPRMVCEMAEGSCSKDD